MISIICVYNNKELLEKFLLKSLSSQSKEYELILIDNTNQKFKSAAEALNKGSKKAKGKYLMFIHQDVDLSSENWLKNVEVLIESMPQVGILGVAGCFIDQEGIATIIKDGIPPKDAGTIPINKTMHVQTLDECLLIIPKSVFNLLKFDEKVCDDWHLYGADYCLSVKKLGFNVFVVPMYIYHRSPGYSFSEKYFITLKKVLKKHKNSHKRISTNTGFWNTQYPLTLQRYILILKGILQRLILLIKKVNIR